MAPAPFPRAARLLTARDFARLRGISQRISGRHFNAEVATAPTPGARLGLAVSRRVSKRAVRRNRIKRIARDSFRHARDRLPAVDILLIARQGADSGDNGALRLDLARLWERIVAVHGSGR